jgi:hypothetical protein
MTWNPELPDAPSTTIDLNSFIFKAAGGGGSDMLGRLRHKFKSSDGKAYGNIFPEVAPLVFPQIDQLASDKDAQKKFANLKRKKEFVGGYLDKRAQAKFVCSYSIQVILPYGTPTNPVMLLGCRQPRQSLDPRSQANLYLAICRSQPRSQ